MSEEERQVDASNVLVVREGHGANCSSIGSVIDTLFVAQVAAGAIIAAVVASLANDAPESEPDESAPHADAPRSDAPTTDDTERDA